MPVLQHLSYEDIYRAWRRQCMKHYFAVVLLVLTAVVYGTSAAFAAATAATSYPIHIQSSLQDFTTLVFDLVGALLGWLVTYATMKWHIRKESADMVSNMLASGLALAHTKVMQAGHDIKDPEIKSEVIAQAVQFFLDNAPIGLRALGLSEAKLVKLATSHLPAVQAGIDAGVEAQTAVTGK